MGDASKLAWESYCFLVGISLANAMENAGLMEQLGGWLAQFSGNAFVLVLVITIVSMFISEVMSNMRRVIVFTSGFFISRCYPGINPLMLGIRWHWLQVVQV